MNDKNDRLIEAFEEYTKCVISESQELAEIKKAFCFGFIECMWYSNQISEYKYKMLRTFIIAFRYCTNPADQ